MGLKVDFLRLTYLVLGKHLFVVFFEIIYQLIFFLDERPV